MKILAMDSSGLVAAVAIAEEASQPEECIAGGKLLAEYTVNFKKTHSQTLLPMIDEIVQMTGLSLETIDAVAVAAGPGSFTGLRIGSATAKGLGLALGKPVVPVPTLEGIAYNLYGSRQLICPLMDARRNQVYTGLYEFEAVDSKREPAKETEYRLHTVYGQNAEGIDSIIQRINTLGREVVFLGDGVPVQRDYIQENCTVSFSFAPAHLACQRAGAVAMLGLQYLKEGKYESADDHKPVYLRVSQAERERKERLGKKTLLAHPESEVGANSAMYRRMEQKDLEEVAQIEAECFSKPWSQEQIEEAGKKPEYLYTVAEKEGKIVAYCTILGVAGEGQITNVAVKKEARGCHYAKNLLKRAISASRKQGNKEFTLEVREGNQPAIHLYENLGFQSEGVRKDFYEKPKENALIMWLREEKTEQ